MRLWPKSLAGQLIAVLLPALVIAQVAGFVITADERVRAIRVAARDEFLMRMGSITRLIETTPVGDHEEIVSGMSSVGMRFWLSDTPPPNSAVFRQDAFRQLERTVPVAPDGEAPLGTFEENRKDGLKLTGDWDALPPGDWGLPPSARAVDVDSRLGTGVVVETSRGLWLNGVFAKPYYGQIWQSQSMVAIVLTATLLSGMAILIARRIARPMRQLSAAAEALGRGEDVERIPEEGPEDIRRMAAAFNDMQDRLKRFLSDRTAMLAAIGHDLRTPITSLRLRAEFIQERGEREKFLATLDEMQNMTEATLSFAREQATGEPTRMVDVAALTESICADLADLGRDVAFLEADRAPYRCRPGALGRAIRNLVENAVRYGMRARVSVAAQPDELCIVVEDDGPGIASADMERVFKPFVRLEGSRSRETGGTGLGLSIARTIARSHGGDVVLTNRAGSGLQATIRLPATAVTVDPDTIEYKVAAE
ncbi:two-component sensor histidine kinase [Mesorhizobium loti]|nr:ATP-binding protein [Mesorhizobium loti]PLP60363.1 two-component sensor histidine kinase [Mesorhizobium loti]